MRLSQKQRIFTKHIGMLIAFAYSRGIELTFGEAHRTKAQQFLYFFGLDVVDGKLVKAKKLSWTLYSRHQDRLAVDFNFFINGKLTYKKIDLQILGDYWESLDEKNEWGGNWEKNLDTPHFERKK